MAGSRTSAELADALGACRGTFLAVGLISGLVNLLCLTGSLFMLEVYDRVLPSRSVPTLVALAGLALVLYAFQGALEALRGRVLNRVGGAIDEAASGRTLDLVVGAPLRGAAGEGLLPLRDLEQIRLFLAGSGPCALFDLPWIPVYVGICFLFHPLIGAAALAGGLVLAVIALITEHATRGPARAATGHAVRRTGLAEAGRRNAEVLVALGMQARLARRWAGANRAYMAAQQRAADVAGGLGAFSKAFRTALQSAVLALGAWLVIEGQASAGVIIASSILVSRALAPAELAIANWKAFVQARQAWARLSEGLARLPGPARPHALPAPCRTLAVEAITLAPPGSRRLVLHEVGFALEAGQGLGVIGPSASGKSSLVRALVGVWPPLRGRVRLDGAALSHWAGDDLGLHLGYLPQEVELFPGTVAENIGRFEDGAPPGAVVEAARAAGAHAMILRLPQGYDTLLGEGGAGLSAGQRQRVGLARALYRDPFLVVLDEPNANLDAEGENALTQAILGVRARGGICVVVAHRPSALAAVDLVLMLGEGRVQGFGPKDEIYRRVLRPAAAAGPDAPPEIARERA